MSGASSKVGGGGHGKGSTVAGLAQSLHGGKALMLHWLRGGVRVHLTSGPSCIHLFPLCSGLLCCYFWLFLPPRSAKKCAAIVPRRCPLTWIVYQRSTRRPRAMASALGCRVLCVSRARGARASTLCRASRTRVLPATERCVKEVRDPPLLPFPTQKRVCDARIIP